MQAAPTLPWRWFMRLGYCRCQHQRSWHRTRLFYYISVNVGRCKSTLVGRQVDMHYPRLSGCKPCPLKCWTNCNRLQDTNNAKLYLRIYYHSKDAKFCLFWAQSIWLIFVFRCNVLTEPFGWLEESRTNAWKHRRLERSHTVKCFSK